MKLSDVMERYVTFKQALGLRYRSEVQVLHAFCRAIGDPDLVEVSPSQVLTYLAGKGPITSAWHTKFRVLQGLYRFALGRGYVERSPLPLVLPKCPPPQSPYIYTTEELRGLLAATASLATPLSPLQATTFRSLLLVLMGTGIRISEALALTIADVQLEDSLLLVRHAKFGKTRLVSTGPHLTAQLEVYAQQRRHLPHPVRDTSAFFATRAGQPLRYGRVYHIFCQLRARAGIVRHDGGRSQPRLHDLRHTAAVMRVVTWYREGADIQRLLPQLATYLGHGDLRGTQGYLTMTADLLQEASSRFEQYAFSEVSHGPDTSPLLVEHLVQERNLARNTQASYRDTLLLLLPFVSQILKHPLDQLRIEQLSPAVIQRFLGHLEQQRGCSVTTRNQRLSAIHALARFIAVHSPEHIAWCSALRAIPFKKTAKPHVSYLDKSEMDAVLAAPNRQTAQGCRDYALLLFLYNTGARASEAAQVTMGDLALQTAPAVRLLGKGNRVRYCPLWAATVEVLRPLLWHRTSSDAVFLNRRQQPITRFGIHALLRRAVAVASQQVPSLRTKRVSPHTIRHTTAVHLVRAGVDINTICGWLGHVSLDTTHIYAEIDLDMKAKALAHCEVPSATDPTQADWHKDPDLLAFLKAL